MLTEAKTTIKRFVMEEEGLALTEYLILLGLLTAGVIVAVLSIGGDLNTAWGGWAAWFEANESNLDGP